MESPRARAQRRGMSTKNVLTIAAVSAVVFVIMTKTGIASKL